MARKYSRIAWSWYLIKEFGLVFLSLIKTRILKKGGKSQTEVEHIFGSVKSASPQQTACCRDAYLFFLSLSQKWSGESPTEPGQISAQFCRICTCA